MAGGDVRLSEPFIRKLEAFGPLSEDDRAMLRSIAADARPVEARKDLIQEGEPPNGVILILKGFAGRYKLREKGTRQIIAYLLPGDFCDLDVAFLSRMDHSIATLSPCQVVRIAPDTIHELLCRPTIARALRMATLLEVANAREWLFSMGQRSAAERPAHLFCELLTRLNGVGLVQGNSYNLPLCQQDLADTAGISAVHMNRSIQLLTASGWIDLRNKRLRILDLPGLRRYAEFKAK